MNRILATIIVVLITTACGDEKKKTETRVKEVPTINHSHVAEYPHDQKSFTEGLLFHQGKLYESSGASNAPGTRSLFGEVDLNTGEIDVKAELDPQTYFGEGITFLNGRVYQLTYTSKKGFIYDASTFELLREFNIPSKEGWGMTTDGEHLIMSDGTHYLSYLDPNTLKVIKKLKVTEGYYNKDNLNELEYVNGYIYANIWMVNEIVKVDPANGHIVGRVDLSAYATDAKNFYSESMDMNGIAYHPENGSFFITGKLWPKIYEIKLNQ